MDIFLDRTLATGQLRPFGEADIVIPLGDQVFHIADGRWGHATLPVRLSAAHYCGVTDVLGFVAEPLQADAEPRWVQVTDLMPGPSSESPTLDCITGPSLAQHPSQNEHTRVRHLRSVRIEDGEVRLDAATAQGLPAIGLQLSIEDLTRDARRTALAWMAARQQALADIDALQALLPALRALSRARERRHITPDTAWVSESFSVQRERRLTVLSTWLAEQADASTAAEPEAQTEDKAKGR